MNAEPLPSPSPAAPSPMDRVAAVLRQQLLEVAPEHRPAIAVITALRSIRQNPQRGTGIAAEAHDAKWVLGVLMASGFGVVPMPSLDAAAQVERDLREEVGALAKVMAALWDLRESDDGIIKGGGSAITRDDFDRAMVEAGLAEWQAAPDGGPRALSLTELGRSALARALQPVQPAPTLADTVHGAA